MDISEGWIRFKNTGNIYDYLEFKNQGSLSYSGKESEERAGDIGYGTINKCDWNDSYGSVNR